MSGGVDSSATAALLLEQGYDVVGITLKLWPQDCVSRAEDKCCGPQAVTDARAVCHKLGIPYYLIDEAAEFQSKVIQYFADEYKAGRTPNPCVMCNQNLKFGRLIEPGRPARRAVHRHRPFRAGWSRSSGTAPARCSSAGATCARTRAISCSRCGRINWRARCFRSARRPRADTRAVARHCQLKTADKEESMEICFVPDNDYGKFLQQAKPRAEASRRDRESARARCWASMTASSFTPSASARAWAFPPPSRFTSSNWMRRATGGRGRRFGARPR